MLRYSGSGNSEISSVPSIILPLVGSYILVRRLIIVVFPEPLRPIIAVLLPFANKISTSFKTYFSFSYAKETCCNFRSSGLEDFIKEVSLDYVVGQNGAMLSGGQKQKIALARALIHDKPIVIFDEATSNTDAYSEQQINGLLDTKLKEKTVIVITHKKEILNRVDQIVVLKEGVVIDNGTYDELVGKNEELNIMMEKVG